MELINIHDLCKDILTISNIKDHDKLADEFKNIFNRYKIEMINGREMSPEWIIFTSAIKELKKVSFDVELLNFAVNCYEN
jgi:hypothetical protein